MSTVTIRVPYSENSKKRAGWCENISQHIDAGNSVAFVDDVDGTAINVSQIQLDTEGPVCAYGAGYTAADAKATTLIAGGWHTMAIGGITAAGTGTGLGIHVRI